jgi:hypothetical protein
VWVFLGEFISQLLRLLGMSNPKRIFWTRVEADRCALEIARSRMLGRSLRNWGYDVSDVSSLDELTFFKRLAKVLDDDFVELKTDSELTFELKEELFQYDLSIWFDDPSVQELLTICDKIKFCIVVETSVTNEEKIQRSAKNLIDFVDSKDYLSEHIPTGHLEQIANLFGLPFEAKKRRF